MPENSDITGLLAAWGLGDAQALGKLIPLVRAELHRMAHRYMAQERPGHAGGRNFIWRFAATAIDSICYSLRSAIIWADLRRKGQERGREEYHFLQECRYSGEAGRF